MKLAPLTLEDRDIFEEFLRGARRELSSYAFAAIYGWKGIFDIRWAIARSSLCVFFKDATGCFLYLPPLGNTPDRGVLEECFRVMDERNTHARISRIENVEERDLEAFRALGYEPVFKSHDFVYARAALAELKGDRFKSKRALANHFAKNNDFACIPYSKEYRERCVSLYKEWMAARARRNPETVYCGMLADSLNCLETLLEEPEKAGIEGLVVLAGEKVAAFTLGCALNDDTLCVLFEISDLSLRGAGQFIFRRFCRDNPRYRLVNAMDDSGLENLRRVKESYRPLARIAAYIVNRPDKGS